MTKPEVVLESENTDRRRLGRWSLRDDCAVHLSKLTETEGRGKRPCADWPPYSPSTSAKIYGSLVLVPGRRTAQARQQRSAVCFAPVRRNEIEVATAAGKASSASTDFPENTQTFFVSEVHKLFLFCQWDVWGSCGPRAGRPDAHHAPWRPHMYVVL
jgi:hypothetical protein